MTIYLEEESEIRLPVDCRKVAEQVVEETLDYEEFPYEAQVEILLTDNEAIREMNREQRGIDFLNNVTTRTIEITCGRIYDYKVKYDEFVVLRKERREQQLRAYENQQKQIQDTEDFIERFRYKATKAVQVQSRIKQL